MATLLAVLKVLGLALAIIIPGGFVLLGLALLFWSKVVPRILARMVKDMDKELRKR